MQSVQTSFAEGARAAKFSTAPTLARPGPMLLNVAITAVEAVTMSGSVKLTRNVATTRTAMKTAK